MQSGDVFTLEAHDWLIKIDAARGGMISECRWRSLEVLSTVKTNAWPANAHAGCFPLVPYSNRIRSAAFSFDGYDISLPAPEFAMPHGLHGVGWRSTWTRQASGANGLIWTHTNIGSTWPWPYVARQHLAINGPRLTLKIEIENTGTRAMPAGIGLHPYFPRRPGLEVSLRAAGFWQTDASDPGLPIGWSALDPEDDIFAQGYPDSVDLDHCFTGWNRTARLDYRDTGLRIDLTTNETLSNIVVYCPADRQVLCLEPVSHINNALNHSGLDQFQQIDRLEPGERLSGTMNVSVSETLP